MSTNWQIGDDIYDSAVSTSHWKIYNILRGGMGVVYIVYDHEKHEPFALKTFQDEVLAQYPQVAERFRSEALTWINLDVHENVTMAEKVAVIKGKPYLFLEYVNGGDLSKLIGTPQLTKDLPQVLRFAIQICNGMAHALSNGIKAHRDVKPQNCLITRNGILKVTDFGLAKVFDDADVERPSDASGSISELGLCLTRGGIVVGTPRYMAPEQFEDSKDVDVRSDIYSFGVMLYEMVSGKVPFAGLTPKELERQHRTQTPPTLKTQDRELRSLVEQCLAKKMEQRFGSFEEVREQLTQVYERLTSEGVVPPSATRETQGAVHWFNKGVGLHNLGKWEEAIACFDRALELNPIMSEAWANKGISLSSLGDADGAFACFARALKLDPQFEQVWVNKAHLFVESGEVNEALACCNRALEINPDSTPALYNKGVILRDVGQWDEALACFERVLELDPRYDDALHNKIWLLARTGRTDKALTCLESRLSIDERDAWAWHEKALIHSKAGQTDEEISCYRRALEINPNDAHAWHNLGLALFDFDNAAEAFKCFKHVLEIDPEDANAWYGQGLALLALRCSSEALESFQQAHRLGHPNAANAVAEYRRSLTNGALEAGPSADEEFARRLTAGMELADAQRWEESLVEYDLALEINPNHGGAWFFRGASLGELGRHEEELECYNRALALNPQLVQAWINKGVELRRAGRTDEAIACYDHALRLEPQRVDAWVNKGVAMAEVGLTQDAMACYERALKINPEFAAAWCNQGSALWQLGRVEEANRAYDRALQINPSFEQVWMDKAHLLMNMGKMEDSLNCYERLLKINPENAQAWSDMGAALAILRKPGAIRCYERALDLDPSLERAWHNKGLEFYKLRRLEEAVACYDRALELMPDYENAWFNKGWALARTPGQHREALRCFDVSEKLGHSQAADAIVWWRQQLWE